MACSVGHGLTNEVDDSTLRLMLMMEIGMLIELMTEELAEKALSRGGINKLIKCPVLAP